MSAQSVSPDPLAQIHELNRLYLRSLQAREAGALRNDRFPRGAIPLLRQAGDAHIDGIAEFPRALFDLIVDPAEAPAAGAVPDAGFTPRQILELTIVFWAWNVSRDSAYHARLFFGLSPRAVHALRTTPLSQLPRFALTSVRVECAFADSEWLWRELLTESRPEGRRRLALVALQPNADAGVFDRVAERGRRDLTA